MFDGGELHLDSRVQLFNGDSRDVLKQLPDNSIDSVVTDPPYALVSIVKRFGGENAAPTKDGDVYARASAGFMGKQWDTGETAFAVEFWAEVMRVLKPGGHVIAASGTRTYHRLAVAIEDAGFEIRDMVQWLYGSGFPKSHDVSKGIDKNLASIDRFEEIRSHIRLWKTNRGFNNRQLNEALGLETAGCGMARHWTSEKGGQHAIPSKDQWLNLKRVLGWPDCELDSEYAALRDGADRPILGTKNGSKLAVAPGQENDRSAKSLDITAPATPEAAQWQGWGTALKPACEPWVLARKPLIGTVAANVLGYGTGAINVEGCRVGSVGGGTVCTNRDENGKCRGHKNAGQSTSGETFHGPDTHGGRFPANVIHDGCLNEEWGRYFYSAKADKMDRIGSKHPTVKPVDLMQYLCRLVTPPGGIVLDPFAGSGSTGEAAWREGFRCVLIEREEEYAEDIRERLRLANQGIASRKRAIAKKKGDGAKLGGLFDLAEGGESA